MSRKLSLTQVLEEGSDTGLLDLSGRSLRTFPPQASDYSLDEVTELGEAPFAPALHYGLRRPGPASRRLVEDGLAPGSLTPAVVAWHPTFPLYLDTVPLPLPLNFDTIPLPFADRPVAEPACCCPRGGGGHD